MSTRLIIAAAACGLFAATGSTTLAGGSCCSPADASDADKAPLVGGTMFISEPRQASPTTNPSAVQRAVTGQEATNVRLATATGGPAQGVRDEDLQTVAVVYGPMPTVMAVSEEERIFLAFPRWRDPVNFTVAELKDGQLVPFPGATTNEFYPNEPGRLDPAKHLVSVQSVVIDPQNRLWVLDTGSINLQPPIDGGPKLWGYDLSTGERVKAFSFTTDNGLADNTYLNDVRFDLSRGQEGYAFISDSNAGAIIVVDLASGEAWRKLDGHSSTRAREDIQLTVEGEPLLIRPPDSDTTRPFATDADGIAIDRDAGEIIYTPLTGREAFAVPIDVLIDRDADASEHVRKVADMASANDGIFAQDGYLYTTDFEDNAVRRIPLEGQPRMAGGRQGGAGQDTAGEIVVQDERLLWPDCVVIHDGTLYVTSNQLHRQPQFHRGQDQRQQPYAIFKVNLQDAGDAGNAAGAQPLRLR